MFFPLHTLLHLYIPLYVCVLSCSRMSNSFVTPRTAGSSMHGISQARILECVAISSSRVPSQPRDQTPIACDLAGRLFTTELPGKPHILILKHSITVSNCFNFTALLRCNSYIIQVTHFKCTIQEFLAYSELCNYHYLNFEHLHHHKKKPYISQQSLPISSQPFTPLPPALATVYFQSL